MGTRNLILIYYKGKWPIAQYGQWDGYPEGQGRDILTFLLGPDNITKLTATLDTNLLIEGTEEEVANLYKQNLPVPDSLGRDTGAHILTLIAEAKQPMAIKKMLDFIWDPQCDYAYAIDLDAKTFETYECGRLGTKRVLKTQVQMLAKKAGREAPALIAYHSLNKLPDIMGYIFGASGLKNEAAYRKDYAEKSKVPSERIMFTEVFASQGSRSRV